MTKRVTSGKRDREKLKEQRRKEKQMRKEERKSSGTSSFEDMIAYVDENGKFHDTPPEQVKTEIDLEDIEVSTPKQEDIVEEPTTGIVDLFNGLKGYGFIKNLADGQKYFFHISAAPSDIAEGNKVTFDIERGARGFNAVNINIIGK